MRIEYFDYHLPEERIANEPPESREGGRMLEICPKNDELRDNLVSDLPERLPEGALVVLNDTRVIPARLLGHKFATGGKVEVFLLRKVGRTEVVGRDNEEPRPAERWRALGKSSKPLRFPQEVLFGDGSQLRARLLGRADDGLLDVALHSPAGRSVDECLAEFGQVPLPPYVKRAPTKADAERYQTVFARVPGAVAAPTAGLHLSEAMLGRMRMRGIEVATVTLHVGLGTFQPVAVDDLDAHPMHEEWVEVPPSTVEAVARARSKGKPVVAVGTTVVRALESAADPSQFGQIKPFRGATNLLIQPGFEFRVVNQLLTNFHLPKSTLLALVSAFGGYHQLRRAYEHAIEQKYRFYSYGDAMLLTENRPADEVKSEVVALPEPSATAKG